jgi:hypothetical protein
VFEHPVSSRRYAGGLSRHFPSWALQASQTPRSQPWRFYGGVSASRCDEVHTGSTVSETSKCSDSEQFQALAAWAAALKGHDFRAWGKTCFNLSFEGTTLELAENSLQSLF